MKDMTREEADKIIANITRKVENHEELSDFECCVWQQVKLAKKKRK